MKTIQLTFLTFLFFISPSLATIHTVPGDFSTIQGAIDGATSGDTVLVSPGTYFENINFNGKNLFLTSLFYLNGDTSYIRSTILDGGSPKHIDTASCVTMVSGEDSTCVLQGFTLTGGMGTRWTDPHGAGIYREGGGILIEYSSPIIQHNVITRNNVKNPAQVVSTGGGGIRISDGNPIIRNNVISYNQGNYGAGIVLNYTGATITNNLILENFGSGQFFGGTGIWIVENMDSLPKTIVNNTIVNNNCSQSNGTGGISVWMADYVMIKNNIIWGNNPALQVKEVSSTAEISYSNVQGGVSGIGNLNQDPLLDPEFLLTQSSPCIDAGDSADIYQDPEDLQNPGMALPPSLGTIRNDMGAYGGPMTGLFPSVQTPTAIFLGNTELRVNVYPNPNKGDFSVLGLSSRNREKVSLFNSRGNRIPFTLAESEEELKIYMVDPRPGIFLIRYYESGRSRIYKFVVR